MTSSYRVLVGMEDLIKKGLGGNTMLAGTHGKRHETRKGSRDWQRSHVLKRRHLVNFYVLLHLFQECLNVSLQFLSTKSPVSSDTIFAHIFCPFSTQLHFTFLTPFFFSLMPIFGYVHSLMPLMFFMFTNRRQGCNSIGTTGHQTTHLLGY